MSLCCGWHMASEMKIGEWVVGLKIKLSHETNLANERREKQELAKTKITTTTTTENETEPETEPLTGSQPSTLLQTICDSSMTFPRFLPLQRSKDKSTWLSVRGSKNIIEPQPNAFAGLTLNVLWSERPKDPQPKVRLPTNPKFGRNSHEMSANCCWPYVSWPAAGTLMTIIPAHKVCNGYAQRSRSSQKGRKSKTRNGS